MIPLYHDFTDETVLVVGGGSVGARKARRFAREARVIVVSLDFSADDYGDTALIRAAVAPDSAGWWIDRTGAALVVAATDKTAVNDALEDAAEKRRVLINRVDRAGGRDAGSVVVPATISDGEVVVAVSTGGNSPALAAELRRRIEREVDGAGELATLTADVRQRLKARGIDPEQRREAVRSVVRSPRVWKDLGTKRSNPRQTIDAIVDATLGDQE